MATDANWMRERIVELGIALGVTAEVGSIAREVLRRDDRLGSDELPAMVDFVSRLVSEPVGTDALWRSVTDGPPLAGVAYPSTPDDAIAITAQAIIHAALNR